MGDHDQQLEHPRSAGRPASCAPGRGLHRAVLHLDVDAFFAQAEVLRRDDLAGRPVVVAGEGRRGVVAAASYEARRHGVRSAMPVDEARRRCRSLVVVPPDLSWYRELSWQVVAVCAEVGGAVARVGLDELYVQLWVEDLDDLDDAVAQHLRALLRQRCGLVASAGVGPTCQVAKLASGAAKPDGVMVVPPVDVPWFLASRELSDLPGVGPQTLTRLHRAQLTTVTSVVDAGYDELRRVLGEAAGRSLWQLVAHGGDDEVRPRVAQVTLGCSDTFPADVVVRDEFDRGLERLADQAVARLQRSGLGATTVVARARSAGFVDVSRSRRLPDVMSDRAAVQQAVSSCADELWRACSGRVRAAGVSFTGLSRSVQLALGQDSELREPPPGYGQAVEHAVFGHGVVVDSDPDVAVVRFGDRVRIIDDPGEHLTRPTA